jgi:hypothetical protein
MAQRFSYDIAVGGENAKTNKNAQSTMPCAKSRTPREWLPLASPEIVATKLA